MAVNVPPNYYDVKLHRGFIRPRQVVLGTSPRLILPMNNDRIGAVIVNTSIHTIFIGPQTLCGSTSGFAMPAGMGVSLSSNAEVWATTQNAGDIVSVLEEYFK